MRPIGQEMTQQGGPLTAPVDARPLESLPPAIILDPYGAGLAVARALVRHGVAVTMVGVAGMSEMRTRGARRVEAPFGEAGEPWEAALARLGNELGEALVIPATDRACATLLAAVDRLPANLRFFERGGCGHEALLSKDSADAIARAAGVRVPRTVVISSLTELEAEGSDLPWPCVVKPVVSHMFREMYSERRVFRVDSFAEARERLDGPLRAGLAMLLSEYVPGGDDHVEEAIVVRTADGAYPVSFGCRKLRQWPAGFGSTALGLSDPLPESTALARQLLDAVGYVGVAGVETKRHAITGEYYFIEANVRIPAQWGLGDAAGTNASLRLAATLAGRSLDEPAPPRPGIRYLAPNLDLVAWKEDAAAVSPLRRPLVIARHLRPYFGAGEIGLANPRDPRPLFHWIGKTIAGRAARLLRRAIP